MPTHPLITHPRSDSVIAWRGGKAVTATQFLADVDSLARQLPSGGHVLNACGDRYRFTVGLAAATVSGKICLLPSTQTPEMIRQMSRFAPDVFCLTDNAECRIDLPRFRFPEGANESRREGGNFNVPEIDCDRVVAYVFTSGSTGMPVPHRKTWGALVRNVQAEAALCGLDDGRAHAIIGTVPPQHMYGFESTVLLVMQSANATVAAKSFYPADICAAIADAPRPRALVSTPVHMRALIGAETDIPAVDLIVSATAPLSAELARELEARLHAPLMEIYGSTETGQIAARRSAQTPEWRLFPGVVLTPKEDAVWASGGHVEQPVPMHDVIEPLGENRFLLHGRTADLVNIAGKRSSLAYLNLQLQAIPGVIDGAFFMPDDAGDTARLTAFAVAPGLSAAQLMSALRERIDMVFLPRPLVLLDSLPRNATGKLPREALQALADAHAKRPAGGVRS